MTEENGSCGRTKLMRVAVSGGHPGTVLTGNLYGPPSCANPPARLCAIAEQNPDRTQLVFTCGSPERKTPCFLVLWIAVIACGAACQFESAQNRVKHRSIRGIREPGSMNASRYWRGGWPAFSSNGSTASATPIYVPSAQSGATLWSGWISAKGLWLELGDGDVRCTSRAAHPRSAGGPSPLCRRSVKCVG